MYDFEIVKYFILCRHGAVCAGQRGAVDGPLRQLGQAKQGRAVRVDGDVRRDHADDIHHEA